MTGFGAYVGMITVEVYHIHPVLKSFVYLLSQSVIKKDCEDCDKITSDDKKEMNEPLKENYRKIDENVVQLSKLENGKVFLLFGIRVWIFLCVLVLCMMTLVHSLQNEPIMIFA